MQTAEDRAAQAALKERGALPRHIAIIMDGNGRWAQERGQKRVVGHHEGVESVRDVTEASVELGIGVLTLYTFSTENWNRPRHEVEALMRLLVHSIREERETLMKNNVRLGVIGDRDQLPDDARAALEETIADTAGNTGMVLNLALSYSGRWEIARAARQLAEAVRDGHLEPDAIDEEAFAERLDTAHLPDPDLLIRTGGELRVSNFLLWQIAYTEMYLTERYWPAFRREQLYDAIRSFQNRDRRFGRVRA